MKKSVLMGALVAPVLAWSCSLSGLHVQDPYVRAVPEGQKTSAAFMTLHNADDKAHTLVSVTSNAAKHVQLHTTIEENGLARMQHVPRLDIPVHESIELKPGQFHIMLMGLNETLVAGETVVLTLNFDDDSHLEVEAPVRDIRR